MWLAIRTLYILVTSSSCLSTPIHMNFQSKKEDNATYYLFKKSSSDSIVTKEIDDVNSLEASKPLFSTKVADNDTGARQTRSFSQPVQYQASTRNKPQLHDIISSVIQQRTGVTPVISSLPLPLENSNHRAESSRALNFKLGNQPYPQIVSPARPTDTPFITFNQQHQQQHIRDDYFIKKTGSFQNQQPLPLETSSATFSDLDLTRQINTNKDITSLFNAPYIQNQEPFSSIDTLEPPVIQENVPLDTSVSTSSISSPDTSPIFLHRESADQQHQNSVPDEGYPGFSNHHNLSFINTSSGSFPFPQLSDSSEDIQDPSFEAFMDTLFPPGEFNMEVSEETSSLLSNSSSARWICYHNSLQSRGDSDSPNQSSLDDSGSYACFSGSFKKNILKHLFDNTDNIQGGRVKGGPLFVFQRGHFANQNFHGK